jgi:ribosomal protein S18 acetylase RimI-like enzyme
VPVRTATPADLDDVLALLTARDLAVLGRVEVQRRHLQHELALAKDGVVAVGDHGLAGYGTLDGAHGVRLAASDTGTADDLLADLERRARQRGFDEVTCIAEREDTVLWQSLERSGYTRERDIVRMWRLLDGRLTPPSWPDGAVVRPYMDADGKRVHALLDKVYEGWDNDYTAIDHHDWLAFMTAHEDFDPSLWFLCERDGELVACSLHWRATDGDGWVKDIVVRETERGRGLGRALLDHAFCEYLDRGAARIGLKVDTNNPTGALQLYESAGFVVDRTYRIWARRL